MVKMNSTIKKWITIVTIILASFLAVFVFIETKSEKEKVAFQEELDEKKRPLDVKKEQLEQELVDLQKDYEQSRKKKATVQVVFTSLDSQVYTLCYPVLKEYGFAGVLALSEKNLPGDTGCMTKEQFQELTDAGWTTCILWDSTKAVDKWYPSLKKKLDKAGIEPSKAMYFPMNTYKNSYDKKLKELGFKIAAHHGEEGNTLIPTKAETDFWRIGSVGLMGNKPKWRMNEAIALQGNMVFTVGFELEEELYNERSYKSMVGYFAQHATNEELVVTGIETAWDYHQGQTIEEEMAQDAAYQKDKSAIEEQLDQVKKELHEIEVLYK